MASTILSLSSVSVTKSVISSYSYSYSSLPIVHLQSLGCRISTSNINSVSLRSRISSRRQVLRAAAVEETETTTNKTPLTIIFQAEGTMNEAVIPTVTNALEGMEGISNLKVQVAEGIASVELTKETTTQATGVASSLVEIIQGLGFTLQTLRLSFEDEEANYYAPS